MSHHTASLAHAMRDDLHLIVLMFPSPSCKIVALFLNQPLSVKISCKGHKNREGQFLQHEVKEYFNLLPSGWDASSSQGYYAA